MTIADLVTHGVLFDAGQVRRRDRNGRMLDIDLAGFKVDPFVLMDKIAALQSADTIARFLHDEGVTAALVGVASKCPMAAFFARETGVTPCFGIDSWSPMHIDHDESSGDCPDGCPELFFDLPAPVARFIDRVDEGCYPELAVEPEELARR